MSGQRESTPYIYSHSWVGSFPLYKQFQYLFTQPGTCLYVIYFCLYVIYFVYIISYCILVLDMTLNCLFPVFCLLRLPFVSSIFFITLYCCALSLRLGLVSSFPSSSSTSFPTPTNPPWLSVHNLLSWIFNFLHFSPFFSIFLSLSFILRYL